VKVNIEGNKLLADRDAT